MKKNLNAVALGSLGGKARARALSHKQRHQIAVKAARARNKKLSPEERRRISMLGVAARKRKKLLREV